MVPAMRPVRAYHLPASSAAATRVLRHQGVELEIACPNAGQWRSIATGCRQAAAKLRRQRPDRILTALQAVVDQWSTPESHWRRLAETALPAVTGFSPEMIGHALPKLIEPLHGDAIQRLLREELRAADGGRRRTAVVPELIVHVLSGNIPGLAAIPIHLSLALGSGAVVKTASGDPLFAALWAQSIAAIDGDLGNCLAVTHWPGGTPEIETPLFGAADLVIASGSDAAIAAIAARVPGNFRGYGHKISFAVVGRSCLTDTQAASDLAHRLAYDISVWDQQGCLSPQLCYVEHGGQVAIDELAALVGEALEGYASELPPRRLTLEEQAAVLRFRQEAEWNPDVHWLTSKNTAAWSIAVESDSDFRPSCLNRCIRFKGVADLGDLAEALAPHRRHLEAAGLAVGEAARADVAAMLARSGVHRVCSIGKMQEPPLSWCQGGRPRVGDWVNWMEVED
jgi:hypothetical protein